MADEEGSSEEELLFTAAASPASANVTSLAIAAAVPVDAPSRHQEKRAMDPREETVRQKSGAMAIVISLAVLWALALLLGSTARPTHATSTPLLAGAHSLAAVPVLPAEVAETKEGLNGQPPSEGGAFCWLVTMSSGSELALVKDHYKHQRSIFRCRSYTVFSDAVDLAPITATSIGAVLHSKKALWGSWYNVDAFLRAWEIVVKERKFEKHDWTVKVDADTVFFPSRLAAHVQSQVPPRKAGYLKCSFADPALTPMLLGAIEVFSAAAVWTFAARDQQTACMRYKTSTGEDAYMNYCLEELNVTARAERHLLGQASKCHDGRYLAFHPLKSLEAYAACEATAKE